MLSRGQRSTFFIVILFLGCFRFLKADENCSNQFESSINESQGRIEPSASFLGMMDYERVGYYMENAGDINGDGCEDFLIATFHNRENGYDAGATYLILGHKDNVWGFKKKLSEADARFTGKDSYDAFGYYVSGNGDIDGD
ncbi:hypothetical protein L0Z72_15150, partial [candidate division KSB1 bacterium]|nr:hypothetical protein [candidate division KSB1 bacterium]